MISEPMSLERYYFDEEFWPYIYLYWGYECKIDPSFTVL